jgi:hypothetical protein
VIQEVPDDIGLVARRHRDQVAHAKAREVVARVLWGFVGEKFDDLVVEAQLAVRDGQALGSRGEALAQRVKPVGVAGRIGTPPSLGDDLAVADQHEAVEGVEFRVC